MSDKKVGDEVFVHFSLPGAADQLIEKVRKQCGYLESYSSSNSRTGFQQQTMWATHGDPGVRARECRCEETRAKLFPHRPSRKNALFLLDAASVIAAKNKWYNDNVQKYVLRVKVAHDANLHRADVNWFDHPDFFNSDEVVRNYWEGVLTRHPIIEVIVDGWVYFPMWNEDPFGRYGLA